MKREFPHDHYPTLDGLRGVACLLVVAGHSIALMKLPHFDERIIGTLGVLVFFSLSGFLMGLLYLSKEFSQQNVYKYLISRFSRITPAYYISLSVYILLSFLFSDFQRMTNTDLIRHFLFTGSMSVYWSIGPEVQFYLYFIGIWGAYYLFLKKNYLAILAISLLSIILILTREKWPGVLLPSKLHLFLFGVASSLLLSNAKTKKLISSLAHQIIIFLIAAIYFYYYIGYENAFDNLIFSALTALLVSSFSATTILTKILEAPFMRFLGSASFSIYLFHGPIIRLLDHYLISLSKNGILGLTAIIILATSLPCIFYAFVEKHLNTLSKSYFLQKLNKKATS